MYFRVTLCFNFILLPHGHSGGQSYGHFVTLFVTIFCFFLVTSNSDITCEKKEQLATLKESLHIKIRWLIS
jgi:hypothetical protein